MRKINVITCMFMGLLLLNSSCADRQTKATDTANVRLFTVRHTGTATVHNFPGRVMASEEVNLAFKVSGTLMRVHVKEGSRVCKGEPIAEIDPRDYRLQLDATEAEYMSIKAEAERVMALHADSVTTADAYDKARYGLQQITAKYENARNQLADTKIYAPFDGYVQKVLFDPPTVIGAGMPVVTIVSEKGQEIEINIPASTYIKQQEIKSYYTSFDFLPEQRISLQLVGITPKANANQLYTMRLSLPQGLSPQPTPGMNAMVHILTDDASTQKTEIPTSALFKKDGQSCVWVYNEKDGTIRLRAVSVERLDTSGNAIITQGITAGERIVSAGVHKLADKQKVKEVGVESQTNVGGLL